MAQRYKYGVRPETEACANCEHFRQHYILDSMGRWEGFIPRRVFALKADSASSSNIFFAIR